MTRVLLVGGGHSHVEVVRRFGLAPPAGIAMTLVSREASAEYSGMLPGHVSGHYDHDEITIDLAALCRAAAARGGTVTFERATVTGIDPDRRIVRTADGRALAYDLLSLNVGSAPQLPRPGVGGLSVKPIAGFLSQLDALADRVRAAGGPVRFAVVGAGPAGVEIACALRRRFGPAVAVTLVTASDQILPGRSAGARHRVGRALQRQGIDVVTGFTVDDWRDGRLVDPSGASRPADEVVWTTSSAAPAWLAATGLALDADGFVRVDETLRSLSHPTVFAAGDIAAPPRPTPKAGVFAVRQGPVLADNLRRAVTGRGLCRFRPQRHWLALISTADGRAIADKFGLSVSGRWVWHWKDRSDRGFVRRYGAPTFERDERH